MPTDRALIDEGNRLAAGASPGPWRVEFDSDGDEHGQHEGRWPCALVGPVSTSGYGDPDRITEVNDLRDEDAELIVWMRNELPEILRRWESDGRALIALATVLEGIAAELGIGPDGSDEEILPRIRQLRTQLGGNNRKERSARDEEAD